MFIDMHMHESTFSNDSFLKLDEMVELAKERGLGAICITDHDDMGLKEYAKEYSEKTGFPIFVVLNFFLCRGISWVLESRNTRKSGWMHRSLSIL